MDSFNINWSCIPYYKLSLDELYRILQLRQEVFIVEQDCPYLDTDDRDQTSLHLCGHSKDGELLAYARLLPKGISYEAYTSIGRVITSEKLRGKKKGRELMQEAIKYTKEHFGDFPIKISAQHHLRFYYGSLGFEIKGEIYDEDGIPHIAMVLK